MSSAAGCVALGMLLPFTEPLAHSLLSELRRYLYWLAFQWQLDTSWSPGKRDSRLRNCLLQIRVGSVGGVFLIEDRCESSLWVILSLGKLWVLQESKAEPTVEAKPAGGRIPPRSLLLVPASRFMPRCLFMKLRDARLLCHGVCHSDIK